MHTAELLPLSVTIASIFWQEFIHFFYKTETVASPVNLFSVWSTLLQIK